jgi:hypothetical protein
MNGTTTRLFAAMAAVLALAACATGPGLDVDRKLALYASHAGAPVDSLQYFGSINGWTPLGDSAIALWTRPREAWLLDLYGPCPDFEFAPAITVSNQMGRVHARFDKVVAHGHGAKAFPCTIRQIRPLDVGAIREAERTARDQPADSGT